LIAGEATIGKLSYLFTKMSYKFTQAMMWQGSKVLQVIEWEWEWD
jgi:hypothetical protein